MSSQGSTWLLDEIKEMPIIYLNYFWKEFHLWLATFILMYL